MRRAVLILVVFGLLLASASAAQAGWVWRNGKWLYIDETEPPPPPTPVQPKPAPVPPKPEARPPTPEAKPSAPETKLPAPEARPPAPAETPVTPAVKPEAKPPAPKAREEGTESGFEPQATKPRWWWQRTEDPNPDRTLFRSAQEDLANKNYATAARSLKTLIKKYPDSPHRAEAMWLRAEALFAQKDYYHAFAQYEDLVGQYAGSPHYHDALAREMEIAEIYFGPERRKVLGVPLTSGDTEAVEILRKVYEHQPTGDLADKAILRVADYYWMKGQWQGAEDYYDKYCREYPNGAAVKVTELRRARCALERCRGPQYDTTSLKLCEDRLLQFRQKYPEMAEEENVPKMLADLHAMRAEALFRVGDYYHRTGQTVAAAHYFEEVQAEFADTPWSGKAEAELNRMKGKGGTKGP